MRFHLATVVLLTAVGTGGGQFGNIGKVLGGGGGLTANMGGILAGAAGDAAKGGANQMLKCGNVLIGKVPKEPKESRCVKRGMKRVLRRFTKKLPSVFSVFFNPEMFTKNLKACKKKKKRDKPMDLIKRLIATGQLDLNLGKKCKDCFDAEQEACYEVLKTMCTILPAFEGAKLDLNTLFSLSSLAKSAQRVQEVKTAHNVCKRALETLENKRDVKSLVKGTGDDLVAGGIFSFLGRGN